MGADVGSYTEGLKLFSDRLVYFDFNFLPSLA